MPIWLKTKYTLFARLEKMDTCILLIGQGLFVDGLTRILTEQPTTQIIGAVNNWEVARDLVAEQQPDIIIVDHDDDELRETDLAPLLENPRASIKIIYLTLTANKMVIHNRQHFVDVSITDLIQALQNSGGGS